MTMKKNVIKRRKRVPAAASVPGTLHAPSHAQTQRMSSMTDQAAAEALVAVARYNHAGAGNGAGTGTVTEESEYEGDGEQPSRKRQRRKRDSDDDANMTTDEGAGPSSPGRYGISQRQPQSQRGTFPSGPGTYELPPLNSSSSYMSTSGAGSTGVFRTSAPSRTHSPTGHGSYLVLSPHQSQQYHPSQTESGLVPSSGMPTVVELERHYAELREHKRKMEEMLERTESVMERVKKSIEDLKREGGGTSNALSLPLSRGEKEKTKESVWPIAESTIQ